MTSNALALEYQRDYVASRRNLNVFDLVNNPSANGKCRVFGLTLQILFFSSRRRHTRFDCDWSSDVCSSDLAELFQLVFERGVPKSKLEKLGRVPNKRGTKVRFHPDGQIFGARAAFKPARIFKMADRKSVV